ncbi:MAG: hemolysin family protein [Myxococcota bacterium]|nr:hemolysin family protein [Myxococcota bacterium]
MTSLLIVVVIVLLASAMCSGTEAALFSTPMIKVRQLAESKVKGAASLLEIRQRMSRPIAMIVIMNNVANIVGSMVIGAMATDVFGAQWIGVFSGALTFMVIIFSEIIPKTVGEKHSESISLAVAKPVLLLTKIMVPLIWLIEKMTNPFTQGDQPEFSTNEKEIRYLARIGDEEGVIEHDEYEMIQGVFKLNDVTAKDLMTPRLKLTCLEATQTLAQAQQDILDSQHSRMVVTESSRDNVEGVALRSELLARLVEGHGAHLVRDHVYQPVRVAEDIKADELLPRFQKARQHLAIVEDEFGGVSGVVTLEDVIEELTGEIIDETDVDEDMRLAEPTL